MIYHFNRARHGGGMPIKRDFIANKTYLVAIRQGGTCPNCASGDCNKFIERDRERTRSLTAPFVTLYDIHEIQIDRDRRVHPLFDKKCLVLYALLQNFLYTYILSNAEETSRTFCNIQKGEKKIRIIKTF